ncbi:MAG: RluA family pseudouridine synthase [Candidatus Berkelbacteria bacterium]|nr:RluA family pseudouridine synthase [Candidatus Berkelbacteria bacterium]
MTDKPKQYIVDEKSAGKRLDVFLVSILPNFSRSKIQDFLKNRLITINGKSMKSSYKIEKGDLLEINPEIFNRNNLSIQPENSKIEIIFENDDFLVVNKPAGIITHPTEKIRKNTLVNWLANHDKKILEVVIDKNNPVSKMRPGIVHRLDKDTSGVMIVAKNLRTMKYLSNEIKKHKIEKTYMALCFGWLPKKGILKNFLGRKKSQGKFSVVKKSEGREAVLNFKSIKYFQLDSGEKMTLAEIKLVTGRTHQIRVQFATTGNWILGDKLYNSKESKSLSKILGISRQLLQAKQISFDFLTAKHFNFSATLLEDFENILSEIEKFEVK